MGMKYNNYFTLPPLCDPHLTPHLPWHLSAYTGKGPGAPPYSYFVPGVRPARSHVGGTVLVRPGMISRLAPRVAQPCYGLLEASRACAGT